MAAVFATMMTVIGLLTEARCVGGTANCAGACEPAEIIRVLADDLQVAGNRAVLRHRIVAGTEPGHKILAD
jgi:hypothetical protein